MPAPRKNDPFEVSGPRNIVTDSARQAELVGEFQRKLDYLRWSFETARYLYGGRNNLNAGLAQLRDEVERGDNPPSHPSHPELQFAVSYLSKETASARGDGGVTEADTLTARQRLVERIKPARQRPADRVLEHHAWALMALLQETSGKVIHATLFKRGVYDPQPTDELSHVMVTVLQSWDPTIEIRTVANLILKARKRFAGKPMRFDTFAPGFGQKVIPL